MALGKRYILQVGDKNDAVEIDNLDIGFRVHRSNTPNNNTGEFDIYNLSPAVIDRFFKKGSGVVFKLGWADQDADGDLTTVFVGDILEMTEDTYLNADRRVSIQAQMIRNPQTAENTIIKMSLPPEKTTLSDVVNTVAMSIGYVVDGGKMLDGIRLPNGFCYVGKVKGVLDYVRAIMKSNGLSFYTDLTDFIIYKASDPSRGRGTTNTEIAYLTWDSGLISVGRLENYAQPIKYKTVNNQKVHDTSKDEILPPDSKIRLSCIINPLITANRVIRVETERISGAFLVDDVEIYGDSSDGPFNMDIEAGNYNKDYSFFNSNPQGDFNTSSGDTNVA